MFGLLHMHKAYRCGNNARRMCLALTYQVAEFHKCRRCIAEYKESIGMLLHSQADACLGTGEAFLCSHRRRARVAEVTFHLYAQPLQSSFADTAGCHRDVCDNRLDSAFLDGLIQGSHGTFVRMQQMLHFKVGGGMYGME